MIGRVDGIPGNTIAHELTHILLNTNDKPDVPQASLALNSSPPGNQDTIFAAKRLSELLAVDATGQRPGVTIESHNHVTAFDRNNGSFVTTQTGPLDIEELLRTPRQELTDLGNNLLRR